MTDLSSSSNCLLLMPVNSWPTYPRACPITPHTYPRACPITPHTCPRPLNPKTQKFLCCRTQKVKISFVAEHTNTYAIWHASACMGLRERKRCTHTMSSHVYACARACAVCSVPIHMSKHVPKHMSKRMCDGAYVLCAACANACTHVFGWDGVIGQNLVELREQLFVVPFRPCQLVFDVLYSYGPM